MESNNIKIIRNKHDLYEKLTSSDDDWGIHVKSDIDSKILMSFFLDLDAYRPLKITWGSKHEPSQFEKCTDFRKEGATVQIVFIKRHHPDRIELGYSKYHPFNSELSPCYGVCPENINSFI